MSKSVAAALECFLAVVLALGVGLLIGGLVGPVPGVGAGLVVVALVGFVLLIAYEKGGSS